jgi:L-fuculose-phosphate aldolase
VTEQALRTAIVAACRQLNDSGLNQGMAGNVSVRFGEKILITPTATPYDIMRPEDIASFPLAGGAQDAIGPLRPSSEWRFHRDLLRARDDIGAVVHAHPPHATALAIARRGIPPCHYMIATFGGEDVRCAAYATFGTAALSDAVTRAMQGRHGCLMANHGMLATGRDLAQAMWRAIELEALARQYLLALSAGGAVLLSPQDIAATRDMFASYRPA